MIRQNKKKKNKEKTRAENILQSVWGVKNRSKLKDMEMDGLEQKCSGDKSE